jgi:hypothetical protein
MSIRGIAALLIIAVYARLSGCPQPPPAVQPVLKAVLTQRFPPKNSLPPPPIVVTLDPTYNAYAVLPAYHLYIRFTGPQVGTGITVDFNGSALPFIYDTTQQINASAIPGGSGWYDYRLNNVGSDVFWEAVIVLPGELKVCTVQYSTIDIRNTSANPNATGTDKVSNPLTIRLMPNPCLIEGGAQACSPPNCCEGKDGKLYHCCLTSDSQWYPCGPPAK